MADEAHVRLVDAHAEGDGGDDDHAILVDEAVLIGLAGARVQPGMIGQRADAGLVQRLRRVLDLRARQAIHDTGIVRMALVDEGLQLLLRIRLVDDLVFDVGPVE